MELELLKEEHIIFFYISSHSTTKYINKYLKIFRCKLHTHAYKNLTF